MSRLCYLANITYFKIIIHNYEYNVWCTRYKHFLLAFLEANASVFYILTVHET